MLITKHYDSKKMYFPKRITKMLNEILEYPLTIIEAPMGYGKTTAIREWLNSTKVNCIWQRIYDSSIENFWQEFIKQLSDWGGERVNRLSMYNISNDPQSIREICQIIEGIGLSTGLVVVIDDYHLLENDEINKIIEYISKSEVDNLHIVLTLRYSKFERIDELKLKGYLHHITKETFEFSSKEIKKYYQLCGIHFNDIEANQLYQHTEGWISAIYLFMLQYATSGKFTPMQSIYNLIENAVYKTLSTEMKDFLISICMFDEFTLKQALYVWREDNTHVLLSELIDSNSFITYNRELKQYTIHSIFLGFLREILEEKEADYRNELCLKIANWFRDNKDYFTAMRYFYACKDYENMLISFEEDKSKLINTSRKELIKQYMGECPKEVKAKHYYALLTYAIHLFIDHELQLFDDVCHEFNSYIKMDEKLDPIMRNRLLGEFEFILSFTEFNDLKKMSSHYKKAWELMQQPTSIYNLDTKWSFGSPSIVCLYYRESGMLYEQVRVMKEAFPYYDRLTNGHGAGAEYVMEAEWYFNQGDFVNAEISAQKAYLKAQARKEESILFNVLFIKSRINFMKGNLSVAIKYMAEMHEEMLKQYKRYYTHEVELSESYFYAYIDQLDKIPERFQEVELSNLRLMFPAMPYFNIVYGRLLLIQGEYLKLIGSSDYFLSVALVMPNLLGQIYTYIYLAAAEHKIFREEDAIANLRMALDIAMPDKLYMPFTENCDYIKSILLEIAGEGSYQEEIANILELYKIYENNKEQIILLYYTEEKPILTSREMEIASLAAEGYTNSAIGDQLFISVNTVKKAMNSIYNKLAINNRALLKQYLSENN